MNNTCENYRDANNVLRSKFCSDFASKAQVHGPMCQFFPYPEKVAAQKAIKAAILATREKCARIAERCKGGYSANIRTSSNEQEFVKDNDGPWVLNSDIAKKIRGSK